MTTSLDDVKTSSQAAHIINVGPATVSRVFYIVDDKEPLLCSTDLSETVTQLLMLHCIFWLEYPAKCKCSYKFLQERVHVCVCYVVQRHRLLSVILGARFLMPFIPLLSSSRPFFYSPFSPSFPPFCPLPLLSPWPSLSVSLPSVQSPCLVHTAIP